MAYNRPTKEQIEDAAKVAKYNVKLVEFLTDWKEREFAELPMKKIEHVAVGQGRCQVLDELLKFIETAPETVAKS